MTVERKPHPTLTDFRPRRATFSFAAKLREPLWVLVHGLPAICSRILERLAPFAVGMNDLRVDSADGRLGESNLGFWALDFQARCEIRLTGVDVQCHALHQVDIRQLDHLIQAVLGAVLESQEDAAFINYEVTVQMHGAPQGSNPEMFLGRFTGPGLEGLGPVTGSGVSFYFGPCSRRISCAVLADMSTSFADSIYVQTRALFDGEQLPKEEIGVETGKYLKTSLAALGLTLPVTGESK